MPTAEKWILVCNCQTHGLAHSLQMLAEAVVVEPVDVGRYGRDLAGYNARFGEYDRVLVGDSARDLPGADFRLARRVDAVPELAFSAYHPDLTYLTDGEANVGGPLDVYHSMIAFLAYGRGWSAEGAASLFTGRTFAACGYLDRWPAARDGLIAYCASKKLDVAESVRRWGRSAAFMYSTNHPRIAVLYDVARLFLEREGYSPRVSDVLPHDNLAAGGVFPVYPEVGASLGVPGAYLFKRAHSYSQIGLLTFIEECFALYDSHRSGALSVHPVFGAGVAQVEAALDAAGTAW